MLSISHSLTGAFIASKLPHPVLYVPLTLGMHYLQDWIPHWDVGTGLSSGRRKRRTAVILELIELSISVALIYYFFKDVAQNLQPHIWFASLIGISPDLLEAPRNFLNWEPKLIRPINRLHSFFHTSTANIILGLIPQVGLIMAIYWMK